MKIKVMNVDDKILFVSEKCIAIERANGEVDIFPLKKKRKGYTISMSNILTLSYYTNENRTETIDGVTITHF